MEKGIKDGRAIWFVLSLVVVACCVGQSIFKKGAINELGRGYNILFRKAPRSWETLEQVYYVFLFFR